MTLKSQAGFSTLIAGLFLAALVAIFISTILSSYGTLHSARKSTREVIIDYVALKDFGQIVLQGYQQVNPSGSCAANFSLKTIGAKKICLPNADFCSQSPNVTSTGGKYCIAKPYVVSQVEFFSDKEIFFSPQKKSTTALLWEKIFPTARAQTGEIWRPVISGAPIVAVTQNTCTVASNECVKCGGAGQNAVCFKLRLCNNFSVTCTSAGTYIEPIFAITTSK